ncbi:MAG: AarF/ABC1/UbiB kinase family protein [Pirellulaceae bacterium]|nr:AarF/ABC1/UbiB kinase family protein [Pirellulaceae bacterium]
MDLMVVPQLVRNADRFRHVVAVLAKHGLADWLSASPMPWLGRVFGVKASETLTTEQHIRLALTELGTTFIKLGQILSTRPDLVGKQLADELSQLRSDTPPDDPAVAMALIESELGGSIAKLYASFEPIAFASASIGQVHRATTHAGQSVVVKVQHVGIEEVITNDLEIMHTLAGIAERQSPGLAQYRPLQTVLEFQKTLLQELDFGRELHNMQRFRKTFADEAGIRFAEPFPELSSRRVLTMERFEGISLSEKSKLVESGLDLDSLARRGANLFVRMIFRDGFYHADPHPGNLMVLRDRLPADGRNLTELAILDCGMVGRIDDTLREDLELGLIAAVRHDAVKITEAVARIGNVPSDYDRPAMKVAIQDLLDDYSTQSLKDFDLSGCLNAVVRIIQDNKIYLPAKVAMLIKVLIMLEGTAQQLCPHFSVAELIEPYGRKALRNRFAAKRLLGRLKANIEDWEHFLTILPRDTADILRNLKQGKFDVHLQHRRLEPVVNRLVMGILTAALFMGSAALCSNQVRPTLLGFSVPGFVGCGVAVVMGFRITLAIRRTGQR